MLSTRTLGLERCSSCYVGRRHIRSKWHSQHSCPFLSDPKTLFLTVVTYHPDGKTFSCRLPGQSGQSRLKLFFTTVSLSVSFTLCFWEEPHCGVLPLSNKLSFRLLKKKSNSFYISQWDQHSRHQTAGTIPFPVLIQATISHRKASFCSYHNMISYRGQRVLVPF